MSLGGVEYSVVLITILAAIFIAELRTTRSIEKKDSAF
jgi:hypothetical protein